MVNIAHIDAVRVVVGVDTHKDEHVAVAIDKLGAYLGEYRLPTTPAGYASVERWAIGWETWRHSVSKGPDLSEQD